MATPNTALATTNMDKIKAALRSEDVVNRFREVIGTYQAGAYVASVLIAVASSDNLMACTPASIVASAMRAATLRLSCDPATGQAYLVPFKGRATLIVGYKGIEQMAIRTNKYRHINCARITEGMEVEEDVLTGTHHVNFVGKRTDKHLGWLGYFKLKNGYEKSLYMTVEEIHIHAQKYSKSYTRSDSPWQTNPEQMERKTVLRLLLNTWGYLDPHDVTVLSAVDESEGDQPVDTTWKDVDPETGKITGPAWNDGGANDAEPTSNNTVPAGQKASAEPPEKTPEHTPENVFSGAQNDQGISDAPEAEMGRSWPEIPADLQPCAPKKRMFVTAVCNALIAANLADNVFDANGRLAYSALNEKTCTPEQAVAWASYYQWARDQKAERGIAGAYANKYGG